MKMCRAIDPDGAWELMGTGGIVLVCTRNAAGVPNLAPVAWLCPYDYDQGARLLFVLDAGHATTANIRATGTCTLALPSWEQKALVEAAGGRSGRDGNKYAALGIAVLRVLDDGSSVPTGVAGWLRLGELELVERGASVLVLGRVVEAAAVPDAWRWRLHLGPGGVWYRPEPL